MITTLAAVLADDPDEMSKLIDDAGPVAGLFVLVLGIVVFFLWRSMRKQLKRIDPELPAGPNANPVAGDGPDDDESART